MSKHFEEMSQLDRLRQHRINSKAVSVDDKGKNETLNTD